MILLEYASKVYHLEASKGADDKRLVMLPETFGKSQSGLNMIYISQCDFTVQPHSQYKSSYLGDGLELHIE